MYTQLVEFDIMAVLKPDHASICLFIYFLFYLFFMPLLLHINGKKMFGIGIIMSGIYVGLKVQTASKKNNNNNNNSKDPNNGLFHITY